MKRIDLPLPSKQTIEKQTIKLAKVFGSLYFLELRRRAALQTREQQKQGLSSKQIHDRIEQDFSLIVTGIYYDWIVAPQN